MGVSYVSIFIVAYHMVFWMLGAAHSLSWDYRPGVPQGEAAERRVSWKEKPIGGWIARRILHQDVPDSFALPHSDPKLKDEEADSCCQSEKGEKTGSCDGPLQENEPQILEYSDSANPDPDVQLARRTSRLSTTAPATHLATARHTDKQDSPPAPPPTPALSLRNVDTQSISATLNTPSLPRKIVRVFRPLAAVFTPVTCTLMVALPIALINPLKALFVDISSMGGPHFAGPDGRPPLAFLLDTGASRLHASVKEMTANTFHNSGLYGWDNHPSRVDPSGVELRPTQDAPPALAAPDHCYDSHDGCQDGRATCHRRVHRAGYDEHRVRRPQGDHAALCHDVPERDAYRCQVSAIISRFGAGLTPAWRASQLIVASLYAPDGQVDTLAVRSADL